tara:strand:+ start:125 stop:397 length:273 start_codon:yes stop_codon:yes gene_type:complete
VCLLCYFCSNADSCSRALSAEAFDYLLVDGYIVEHIHVALRGSPSLDDQTPMVVDLEVVACPSATDCLAILGHLLLTSDRAAVVVATHAY